MLYKAISPGFFCSMKLLYKHQEYTMFLTSFSEEGGTYYGVPHCQDSVGEFKNLCSFGTLVCHVASMKNEFANRVLSRQKRANMKRGLSGKTDAITEYNEQQSVFYSCVPCVVTSYQAWARACRADRVVLPARRPRCGWSRPVCP